ncbi:ATPase, partial [bacterium SCN 62-11]
MANADQLKSLVKSWVESDDLHFSTVAMQIAAQQAGQGHSRVAKDLLDLVNEGKRRRKRSPAGQVENLAQPRGEIAALLTAAYPLTRLSDMVLESSTLQSLELVVRENQAVEALRQHGLEPKRKLLLVGPPGSGKTMTAGALAGELGLPQFTIRLDALISRMLGETASNLRSVFDHMRQQRGVYLLDEFDSIAPSRALSNDVGEIRRILNSLLQLLEMDTSDSLLIAATNHPELLDSALYRRFDQMLHYQIPTWELAAETMKNRLASFSTNHVDFIRAAKAA